MLHSLAVEVVEAFGAADLHKVDVALRAVKDLVHTHDKVLGEDGYCTRKARFQAHHGVSVVDFPLKVSAATSRSHGEGLRVVWSDLLKAYPADIYVIVGENWQPGEHRSIL